MAQALAGALEGGSLLVVNRTWSRATQLAARCGGRAIEWSALPAALVQADVLLASTGSPDVLLVAADLESVLAATSTAVPCSSSTSPCPATSTPRSGPCPGVTLLDMDDLTASAAVAMAGRRQEVPRAEAIVAEELERYLDVAAQRQVAPLVAALHERGEAVRAGELSRFRSRLAGLDPAQAAAVDALTRGIVAKLLHEPTVNVKAGAGTPGGEQLAQGLRRLFELDT